VLPINMLSRTEVYGEFILGLSVALIAWVNVYCLSCKLHLFKCNFSANYDDELLL